MKKIIPSILLAVSAGSSPLLAQITTNYEQRTANCDNNQVTGCRLQVTRTNQDTNYRLQTTDNRRSDNLDCHLMIDPVELKNIEEGIEDVKGAFGSPAKTAATTFSPAESSSFSTSSSRISVKKGLNSATIQITTEDFITGADPLLDRTYLCSYGTSGVKIYIRSLSKRASADEVQGVDGAEKFEWQELLDASGADISLPSSRDAVKTDEARRTKDFDEGLYASYRPNQNSSPTQHSSSLPQVVVDGDETIRSNTGATKQFAAEVGFGKRSIESQQLWIEQENGESRALNPWEIKNFNEVATYLSQSRAETMLPEMCYARVMQTNINEYSVSLNFRMLGGGTCTSVPMPEPEMIIAARTGDSATINRLLESGIGADLQKSHAGDTALACAADEGSVEIVRVLLAARADVNGQNNKGISALEKAAKHGHTQIVQDLIAAGADVNNQVLSRSSALCRAAKNGHTQIVQDLIAARANINSINACGLSALYLAVSHGHPQIVKILLEVGASRHQKNRPGEEANDYVCVSYTGPDKAGVARSITSLLNNPPVAVDYAGIAAAKRAVQAREHAEAKAKGAREDAEVKAKNALDQRIQSNQAQYEQTLFKIARSVIRQLFEDDLNAERQEMVQSTLHNFLKSSLLLKDAGVDLPDDASHTARRASVTTALVSELKPKKYLWGSTDFDAGEIQDELKNIILIWSSKIKEETLEKSRLERMEDRLTTIGNNVALSQSQAPVQNASMTEDAARAAANGAAQEVGMKLARAALGVLF